MITVYVTKNKAITIETISSKHPLIYTGLSDLENHKNHLPSLVRTDVNGSNEIVVVLTEEEFKSASSKVLESAIVLQVP